MKKVLRFWLDLGASGFRVDAVNHLFEYADLRNEPIDDPRDPLAYGYTRKDYTKDLVRKTEIKIHSQVTSLTTTHHF